MPRILDYNGRDADRTVTVADIAALKHTGRQLAQVTASNADESAAAEVPASTWWSAWRVRCRPSARGRHESS